MPVILFVKEHLKSFKEKEKFKKERLKLSKKKNHRFNPVNKNIGFFCFSLV